jgi:ABC-type glycerol-3-phosphate transport system permease component
MSYFSFHFLLYLGRWLLSAVVMFFPMWALHKYTNIKNKYYILVLVQIYGAFVFYYLDAYIFSLN